MGKMRLLGGLALAMVGMLVAPRADAALLVGYLAECTAVAAGSCTEMTTAGYARQPIAFTDPARGVSVSQVPYTFGPSATGTIAGRAVFDAPTGGNLVLVLPLASALSVPPVDAGDVGALRLTVASMVGVQDGRLVSGILPAGSVVGSTPDGSVVTAGVQDVIRAGVLSAAVPTFDATYAYRPGLVSGFAIANLVNSATLALQASGTLAAGSVTMPSAPTDGQTFRLACGVTVSSLSVLPAAGQTLVGSVSTCGPAAGHEWFYVGGTARTWFQLI